METHHDFYSTEKESSPTKSREMSSEMSLEEEDDEKVFLFAMLAIFIPPLFSSCSSSRVQFI
jgi:hypothetical protein